MMKKEKKKREEKRGKMSRGKTVKYNTKSKLMSLRKFDNDAELQVLLNLVDERNELIKKRNRHQDEGTTMTKAERERLNTLTKDIALFHTATQFKYARIAIND